MTMVSPRTYARVKSLNFKARRPIMATTAATRVARIELSKVEGRPICTVCVPKDITRDEIGRLNDVIIDSVIRDLTGCACLSGVVDVIFKEHFGKVIDVQF